MKIKIVTENSESLTDLLCQLSAYYSAGSVDRKKSRLHIDMNLLGRNSPSQLVAAYNENGSVMGFAAIILMHSLVNHHDSNNRQCQIKELFVSKDYRGQAVGEALMQWVAAYALRQGCCRMDWNVKSNNLRGIKFYEGLGGQKVADRLSYRIQGVDFLKLAGAE